MNDPADSEWNGQNHHFTVLSKKQIGPDEKDFVMKEWEGYILTRVRPDGTLAGFDIRIAKAGAKLSGTMRGWAEVSSLALSHGVSVKELCRTAIATNFEPNGPTRNPEIPRCTSLFDYIGRYLLLTHEPAEYAEKFGKAPSPTEGEAMFATQPANT